MPRKRETAGDLLKRLESDTKWVADRARRDIHLDRYRQILADDEADLLRDVRSAGYEIDSVWDLVNNVRHPILERKFVGEYRGAYPVLVKHLVVQHHERIREGIIRALTVKDGGPEVEIALLVEFEKEPSQSLRWVLANALKTVMPYHRRKKHPRIALAYKAGMGLGNSR